MAINTIIHDALDFMKKSKLDGWLIYDYKGSNNVMSEILGKLENVTRPIFLWIPGIKKINIVEKILKDQENKYPVSFLKTRNKSLFHCY